MMFLSFFHLFAKNYSTVSMWYTWIKSKYMPLLHPQFPSPSEIQDVYFTRCPDLSRGKRQNFKKHFYMQNIFKATCNFLGKDAACCYSFLNRPPKAPFLWPHHRFMKTWIKLETTYKPPHGPHDFSKMPFVTF